MRSFKSIAAPNAEAHLPLRHARPTHLSIRTALLWLLAIVVPLQCGIVAWRSAAGPLHSHQTVARAAPVAVLSDFRRDVLHHAHAHASGLRHHHAGGDAAATMAIDAMLATLESADDGAGGTGSAFGSLTPLVAMPMLWQPSTATHILLAAPPWAASKHVGALPKRPPRTLAP